MKSVIKMRDRHEVFKETVFYVIVEFFQKYNFCEIHEYCENMSHRYPEIRAW